MESPLLAPYFGSPWRELRIGLVTVPAERE